MRLEITKYGQPVLETVAEPITDFGADLLKLVEDMFETMYFAKGVGLAAPQVNVSKRLTVIDVSSGAKPDDRLVLINPEIVRLDGSQVGEEGCLSIPGFREDVRRAMSATVRAQNARGEHFEVTGEELLARALQHEIDHLNGILFTDHAKDVRDLPPETLPK